jgi:acetyl-CoA acyltransferase
MYARYNDVQFNQGVGAEMVAERWSLNRTDIDAFSLESHRRAARATAEGRFCDQLVPVPITDEMGPRMMDKDEGIRADTSLEKLGTLKTVFKENGVVTAGNSSQISDGAAAILVMERGVAEKLGFRPRARVVEFALAGDDPVIMLTAPMPATKKLLARAGLTIDDVDLYEVNEAFATVPMAWLHDLKADPAKLNINGGAVALGHPLGASGARLMTTLVHELERTGGRYGLQTMCEGGGLANATLIERMS